MNPQSKPASWSVIGIDGGGTRSEGLLMSSSGQVLARRTGGALNYHTTCMEVFRKNLGSLLEELRGAVPEGATLKHCVVGTAALFDRATAEETRAAARHLLDPERLTLVGDAVAAMHGASGGDPGVLIVAGTGSIAALLQSDGTCHTSGGYGPLIGGDPGSAFWMASTAVQVAARHLAQNGTLCPLGQAIIRYLEVESLEQIVPRLYRGLEGSRILAGLSRYLADADLPVDAGHVQIQRQAGAELAGLAAPLVARLSREKSEPVGVFMAGSVLRNNRLVRESMQQAMRDRAAGPLEFLWPRAGAAEGAAWMALRLGKV